MTIIWKRFGDYLIRKGEPSRPFKAKARGRLMSVAAFTEESPEIGNRFPGDPGIGKYYYGGREDQLTWSNSETAISNWESRMAPWSGGKKLGMIRLYASASLTTGFSHTSDMTRHYNAGRIPHVSFKFPSSWGAGHAEQMAKAIKFDADWDRWMNALANQMLTYAPKPVWWTFWHEPEDFNTATLASQYRQVCRRMVKDLDARGVTNHTFVSGCCQAPYNYGDKGGTRDWRWWYPDWKGTSTAGGGHTGTKDDPNPADFYIDGDPNSVVDVNGLDVYNWWGDGEAFSNYYTFEKLWSRIKARNDFLGKPYAIGEYGIEAYHTGTWAAGNTVYGTTNNNITKDNIKGMFDLMPSYGIIALEVYNYALVNDAWRLEIEDPDRARYEGYGRGVARAECVLPNF